MHLIKVWYLYDEYSGSWVLGDGEWVKIPKEAIRKYSDVTSLGFTEAGESRIEYFSYKEKEAVPV